MPFLASWLTNTQTSLSAPCILHIQCVSDDTSVHAREVAAGVTCLLGVVVHHRDLMNIRERMSFIQVNVARQQACSQVEMCAGVLCGRLVKLYSPLFHSHINACFVLYGHSHVTRLVRLSSVSSNWLIELFCWRQWLTSTMFTRLFGIIRIRQDETR